MCHMELTPTYVHGRQTGLKAQKEYPPAPCLLASPLDSPLDQRCINTCSHTNTAGHAERYLRTDINTFSNLRQHELTVAGLSFSARDVFPRCFTGGRRQRSSPLLKEGVRGDRESPPSSWTAITGSGFPKAEGKWMIAFYLSATTRGVGKTISYIQFTHSDSLNTRNALYDNCSYY